MLGKRKAPTSSARMFRVVKRARAIMGSARYNRRLKGGRTGRYLNRRGQVNRETGFVDQAFAAYVMDTTGVIILVATIPQGASVNSRVGKKILYKSIQVRGNVNSNSAAVTPGGAWIIVYDRRPTGSLPAITDVLVTANNDSFTNDANSSRFKIIRRQDYAFIGNTLTPTTGKEVYDVNEFIKLRNLPAVFKAAATGAIGDISEGALYLICVGNFIAGTTAAGASLGFRTRFVDI